jgi:hypothetical protein
MKNRPSLFEIKPSNEHDQNVLRRVNQLLETKRSQERRKFWSWILIPASAVASLILAIKLVQKSETETANEDLILVSDLKDETEFEILAELEILEDMEELEAWDESSDT